MNEFILTIVSITFGFLLSQISEWFKERNETKSKNNSVRLLIKLESENNKNLLFSYWKEISLSDTNFLTDSGQINFVKLAYALKNFPFPKLSRDAWSINLNIITEVFKTNELQYYWDIYKNYEQLYEIQQHLLFWELEAEKHSDKVEANSRFSSSIIGNVVKSFHFNENAIKLSKNFKEIIEKIIGNNVVVFSNKQT